MSDYKPFQPQVSEIEVTDRGHPVRLRGKVLGAESSRRSEHNHPTDQPLSRDNDEPNCRSCFWTELKIVRVEDADAHRFRARYAVYTAGVSSVPGTEVKGRLQWTSSAFKVVVMLTRVSAQGIVSIPRYAALALADAAGFDEDMEAAWVARTQQTVVVVMPCDLPHLPNLPNALPIH